MPDTDVDVLKRSAHSRAVAERFFAACNTHDLTQIMSFFHPDIVHHARLSDYAREGVEFVYKLTLDAFPDLQWHIDEMVAEGDRVVTLVRYEGTHRGDYLGQANTGRHVSFFSMNLARVEGEQFIEHRGVLDELHLLTQIDALPAPYLAQMS